MIHSHLRTRVAFAAILGISVVALAAFAAGAPDTYNRGHEGGLTTLRFHKGQLHFALVLDAAPKENGPRRIVTADGREIPLHWSGRSVWINEAKYELPFGAVFLVSTKGAIAVKQIDFNAMRGRLLLDQAAAAPAVVAWLEGRAKTADEVVRGAVQAATYPRHTLETTGWTYRGAHAYTCVVSGSPHFVVFSDGPITAGSSTQTFLGDLDRTTVVLGDTQSSRTLTATRTTITINASGAGDAAQSFELDKGRVFLVSERGARIVQAQASLDAGFGVATMLADEIERMTEVREHLGLEVTP